MNELLEKENLKNWCETLANLNKCKILFLKSLFRHCDKFMLSSLHLCQASWKLKESEVLISLGIEKPCKILKYDQFSS